MKTSLYIEELKNLWEETFGDTRAYIDDFFQANFLPQNTLIHVLDGKLIAALYLIPYEQKYNTQTEKLYYLYALATKEANRCQGIMEKLLKRAEQTALKRGINALFLIPATPRLFAYYAKSGYKESGTLSTLVLQHDDLAVCLAEADNLNEHNIKLQLASNRQIWANYLRSPYYQENCILLSHQQNDFYLGQLEKSGGKQMLFSTQKGVQGYILYHLAQRSNIMTIYESDVTKDLLPYLLRSLAEIVNFQKIVFNQPFSCMPPNNFLSPHLHTKSFVMVKKLSDSSKVIDRLLVNRVLK